MLKLKHLNHYYTKLTSTLLEAGTGCDVDTLPPSLAAGYRYRMQLQDADPFSDIPPVNVELVDVISTGATLTLNREVEDASANPARDWIVDPGITDVWLVSVDTAESRDKLNGVEIVRFAETGYETSSATFNRSSGGRVKLTLEADATLDWGLDEGEKIQALIIPGVYNITAWGIDKWMSEVPDFGNGATEYMVVAEMNFGLLYGWWQGSN